MESRKPSFRVVPCHGPLWGPGLRHLAGTPRTACAQQLRAPCRLRPASVLRPHELIRPRTPTSSYRLNPTPLGPPGTARQCKRSLAPGSVMPPPPPPRSPPPPPHPPPPPPRSVPAECMVGASVARHAWFAVTEGFRVLLCACCCSNQCVVPYAGRCCASVAPRPTKPHRHGCLPARRKRPTAVTAVVHGFTWSCSSATAPRPTMTRSYGGRLGGGRGLPYGLRGT